MAKRFWGREFEGKTLSSQTPLEIRFSSSNGGSGLATNPGWSKTPKKRATASRSGQFIGTRRVPTKNWVTGRASAANRWPIGFEFEMLNFKTAKVGQKFKSFPVPLSNP